MAEVDLPNIKVGKSKLNEIMEEAFSKTNPAELSSYRGVLYTNLAETEKLTWAKFVIFLSSFCIFYLLSAKKVDTVPVFGLELKDVGLLRKAYPFYIFYSFYQFFYSYVWSGVIQYQLDGLNDALLGETAKAKLHYFTLPANPHLFRNWAAQHLGVGVITHDLFMSLLGSAVRIAVLLGLTCYVYYVNVRDYGFRDILVALSLVFGLAVFLRFGSLVRLYNTLVMRPLSKNPPNPLSAD
jgi:hypothetical protein